MRSGGPRLGQCRARSGTSQTRSLCSALELAVQARDALTDIYELGPPVRRGSGCGFLLFRTRASATLSNSTWSRSPPRVPSPAAPSPLALARYTYVFNVGSGRPTGDITADCVAKAFGVPITTDPRALAILQQWVKTRIPRGAVLILNKGSGSPGFWIANVIVMAGALSIMQAMLDEVAVKLNLGVRMLSETMRADAREGDIGIQLSEIAKANPAVAIGSYPFFDLLARAQHECGGTRREGQKLIPKRADPDSSCGNSSGTSIAKTYGGPMRYGHSAQAPTLAKMSQAFRSLVLRRPNARSRR
jgi:hypothetical protein